MLDEHLIFLASVEDYPYNDCMAFGRCIIPIFSELLKTSFGYH